VIHSDKPPDNGRNSLWITASARASGCGVVAASVINAYLLPISGGFSVLIMGRADGRSGVRAPGAAPPG
jgi:hypothetical protein